MEQVEQGMQGAVGVPKRKNSVVVESLCLMDVVVQASVLSVHVRINHRVIQRSVKHSLLVLSTFDLQDGQFLVPFGLGFGQYLVETAAIGLGMEVGPKHLAVVVIDGMGEIDDDVAVGL